MLIFQIGRQLLSAPTSLPASHHLTTLARHRLTTLTRQHLTTLSPTFTLAMERKEKQQEQAAKPKRPIKGGYGPCNLLTNQEDTNAFWNDVYK